MAICFHVVHMPFTDMWSYCFYMAADEAPKAEGENSVNNHFKAKDGDDKYVAVVLTEGSVGQALFLLVSAWRVFLNCGRRKD